MHISATVCCCLHQQAKFVPAEDKLFTSAAYLSFGCAPLMDNMSPVVLQDRVRCSWI